MLRQLDFSFPLLTDTLSLHCVITKCQQQLLLLFQYSNSDDAVNGEDGMMLQDDEGEEKKGNVSVRTNGGWTNGSRTNNLMSSVASVLLPNSSRSSLIQKRPSDRRFIQKGFFFILEHNRCKHFCGCCPHSEHSLNVSGLFCPRESKAKQSQTKYLL